METLLIPRDEVRQILMDLENSLIWACGAISSALWHSWKKY
jgi:hypothetical protein